MPEGRIVNSLNCTCRRTNLMINRDMELYNYN